jgi:N-acetylmuramoyl-L-alanine amidase
MKKITENTVKQGDLPAISATSSILKKVNKRIIKLFKTNSLRIAHKINNETKKSYRITKLKFRKYKLYVMKESNIPSGQKNM